MDNMQTNMFLRSAAQNRMGQQVRAAAFARAFGDRDHAGAFQRATLQNQNLQPADWLKGSPWADLLNNF